MTSDKIPPAPAKDDSDTDMQTSTQEPTSSQPQSRQRHRTNAGVKKRSRTNRNRPIQQTPILPWPTLPIPLLPLPKSTLPAPTLPAPTLPAPTLPAPTLPAPKLPTFAVKLSRPREPDLFDEIMAIVGPKRTRYLPNSSLGKMKAMLGDTIGTDNRKRPEIRREGTTILGDVYGEYKPAVWHDKERERLILMDAQQAGAPVWRPGMSLDYTSYSPLTSSWTNDPATIRDHRGRQVCLMDQPPKDWHHNPEVPYLMFEDKVVLDVNNRPIKDYKGAPLTISIEAEGWLLEGLYRTLGMTISDMMARMRPIRYMSSGPKLIQISSHFTNKRNTWKAKMGMKQWRPKELKQSEKTVNNSSGVKAEKIKKDKKNVEDEDVDIDEEEEKAYSMPESTSSQSMETDDTDLALANHVLSAMPESSSATTASHGLMQNQTRQSYPSVSQNGSYDFDGARDMSQRPYCTGQSEYVEQSREGTWTNAPTFPAANMPVTNTNSTTTGINTSTYPFQFFQQNIYAGQGTMSAGAYPYGQPTTGYAEQTWRGNTPTFSGANMAAQMATNVGSGNINTSGYPSMFPPQNMYTAAPHPFETTPLYTTNLYNTDSHQHTTRTPYPSNVPAPNPPITRPMLGGYGRPDPSLRYGVDDFWDQEMARQEPPATDHPARVQATPQPTGPPRSQPLPIALPPPVPPAESSNTSLSSPAEDPFVGAEYNLVSPDDWLNSDELWHGIGGD